VCSHRALSLGGISGLDGGHDSPVLDEHLLQPGGPAQSHGDLLLMRDAELIEQQLKVELERGTDFYRLANALSALYPKKSEEKRLLDAMLLAVPR